MKEYNTEDRATLILEAFNTVISVDLSDDSTIDEYFDAFRSCLLGISFIDKTVQDGAQHLVHKIEEEAALFNEED